MSSETKDPPQPRTIQFHYIKSNHFRVVHVDGAVAGIGPGTIFLSLFSERIPIPQLQVFPLTADNKLGQEQMDARVVRTGIVREVEVGVAMSIQTAEAVRDLLAKHIDSAKQARGPIEATKSE